MRHYGFLLLVWLLLAPSFLACKGKSEEDRLAEANKQLREGNVLGATLLFKDFLKKFPKSQNLEVAQFGLSQCYVVNRDYAKAREVLDDMIQKAGGTDTDRGVNATILKMGTYEYENKLPEALDVALKTSDTLQT